MSSILLAGVTSYENLFHKKVVEKQKTKTKKANEISYWQKRMRDQKQQSNRQWCKHKEKSVVSLW